MTQELAGKVALVTGGGRGLGQALCEMLGKAGAITLVADMRSELAENVALDIQAQGGKAIAIPLDITDDAKVSETIADIIAEHGRLDILINNAGTDVTLPITELDIADWDRVMAVNLRAPFVLSKLALTQMQTQGSGYIINITSTAAKRVWTNASVYHASKWGLLGFSHALHVEGRPYNVKVTAVIAGGMTTPFLLDRFPDIDVTKLQDPKNVADTVRYLLSQPGETVIPEVMVLPMKESSWP